MADGRVGAEAFRRGCSTADRNSCPTRLQSGKCLSPSGLAAWAWAQQRYESRRCSAPVPWGVLGACGACGAGGASLWVLFLLPPPISVPSRP